jgi:hypothetical protein
MTEKKWLFLIYILLFSTGVFAGDSLSKKSPVTYSTIIPADAVSKRGLLTVHNVKGKYYLEIPNRLLGKEMLVVTRIQTGATSSSFYAGDEISNMVIAFEKGNGNKLLIRKKIYTVYAGDSLSNMYQAVNRSNLMPILYSFNVETVSKDSSAVIIDASPYILGDNEGFTLNPFFKASNSITDLNADKTFIESIMTFPENIEIATEKTFSKRSMLSVGNVSFPVTSSISFVLNTSIVVLPDIPMKIRSEDKRVGYFSLQQTDYGGNPNGIKERRYIKRWRLEPKINEIDKYRRGELVEPEKPIIFYIDPATPSKWIPYLIQGVNDWKIAFQQAGFKDAISAKVAPTKEQDSTWSLYDARHSAIIYKPSPIENASGPSITDPRTGEILESHINWYHNVMQLVHDWYMIQCGVNDVNARKMVYDDSLMGQLIRVVCAHEVGHTLGLKHNFGASSTIPVEKLRDKKWVEENGFCPSIMDYARFNYVAQVEDSISQRGLMPRIGGYDKWAIEWGYRRYFETDTSRNEQLFLTDLVTEKLKNEQLWYSEGWDPRAQAEDLGDDVVKSNSYGIKNLKIAVSNLVNWSNVRGEGYESLNRIYNATVGQFKQYCLHVVSNIGGVYENIKVVGEPGAVYKPLSIAKQKEALLFLDKNLFNTPSWLIDSSVLMRTGQTALGVIGGIQDDVFRKLLFEPKVHAMVSRSKSTFGEDTYMLNDFLDDLKGMVWKELKTHKPINEFRRSLQKMYLLHLIGLIYNTGINTNVAIFLPYSGRTGFYGQDALAIVYAHMHVLQNEAEAASKLINDRSSKDHLKYISQKIRDVFTFIENNHYN